MSRRKEEMLFITDVDKTRREEILLGQLVVKLVRRFPHVDFPCLLVSFGNVISVQIGLSINKEKKVYSGLKKIFFS